MAHQSPVKSFSFEDMKILTGWQTSDITYKDVDLSVELAPKITLRCPFIAAAMGSVVGYEMALECARNGIMAVVPCGNFSIEEQAEIIREVKNQQVNKGDIEYNQNPVTVRVKTGNETISECYRAYKEFGHSAIPVVNDFRHLLAMFLYIDGIETYMHPDTKLVDAIEIAKEDKKLRESLKPFDLEEAKYGTDFCIKGESEEQIKNYIKKTGRCMPVLMDDKKTLAGLAFVYKYHGYLVAGAVHTHSGWEKRAESLIDVGADMIFIDASHGATDFQLNVLEGYKKKYEKPICAGNFITTGYVLDIETGKLKQSDYLKRIIDAGADVLKVGMGTGSTCITTYERGIGRNLPVALKEIREFLDKNNYNIPIIADGGIPEFEPCDGDDKYFRIKEMSRVDKALIWADAIMMGGWFNSLKEAAGDEINEGGVAYKLGWGEGSLRAHSLRRYNVGEDVRRAAIAEGVERRYLLIGRLKPNLEREATRLAMTLCNVGARNLNEYRKRVVYEL